MKTKTRKCKYKPCSKDFEAKKRSTFASWTDYCKDCSRCKVYVSKFGQNKRDKELDAEKTK